MLKESKCVIGKKKLMKRTPKMKLLSGSAAVLPKEFQRDIDITLEVAACIGFTSEAQQNSSSISKHRALPITVRKFPS